HLTETLGEDALPRCHVQVANELFYRNKAAWLVGKLTTPDGTLHVNSNYDIDLFRTLIEAVAKVTGATDLGNKSLRVIADHIRSC
ncbi:bifunctional isocitrate dehydrogenase kinase/phosphatase, partial [Salmonella enterica subsp. enterica serovar Kentucky]|nr:bifunctional isocitrate dehydrogenase kinase/phosphatase [Salmonella enterica subsp. enterica serovar Kentucky]